MALPLPAGWTEHVSPTGQPYWYNASTRTSTYHRPAPPGGYAGPPPPLQTSSSVQDTSTNAVAQQPPVVEKKKKEKPKVKQPIPGTEGWIKVITTHDNVFYSHPESARSEWTVPDEIKDAVRAMDEREEEERRAQEERRRKAEEEAREAEENAAHEERERIEAQQRVQREEEQRSRKEQEAKEKELRDAGKRKRGEELDDEDEDVGGVDADELLAAPADEGAYNPPPQLSHEESKALFMLMLTSLNGTPNEINPMAPWDKELVKFVHLNDYGRLTSLRDRQDAFNEWCKLRLREKRKAGPSGATKPSTVASDETEQITANASASTHTVNNGHARERQEPNGALETYRALLQSSVTSTRTKWEDFRKKHKKERSFFAFGRNDAEREKEFKKWLRELGERKRAAAEKAEEDFVHLLEARLNRAEQGLSSTSDPQQCSEAWSKAKRQPGLDTDARYEAVASSSRRADLFVKWVRGELSNAGREKGQTKESEESATKKRDAATALREREDRVRRERAKMEQQNQRTIQATSHEESVVAFSQLLVDAVTNPHTSWSSAQFDLASDGRFRSQTLQQREKEDLFRAHLDKLQSRKLAALHCVFEKHAPQLNTAKRIALPLVRDDEDMEKGGLGEWLNEEEHRGLRLEEMFERWNDQRHNDARRDFDKMLKESSFISFWGALRAQRQRMIAAGQDTDATDAADEDDDVPSLLKMAGSVDLEEVHATLQNDARYRAFDFVPEKRDAWMRSYLQQMDVPKSTAFQAQAGSAATR
ncbi:Transcription factor CA150 [Ceraceosorus bombacis]|uniref:Transcription factor CA150 n=1 Tax=Ceraceosorus bombacis TaxID=401625 RepID=A0A0P1BF21_9BASI|nr:Transcription factor CA150 [Ceraceosorus bombacis]